MEYLWKPNTRFPVDAQAAGERIETLSLGGTRKGTDLRQAIVADARPDDAPLHPCFEWDDTVAAEKYREDQAGHIVRALVTMKEGDGGEMKTVRAFVSVTVDDEPHYTTIAHAMGDSGLRAQVVEKAWQELVQWREKYEDYKELARIAGIIDREAKRRVPPAMIAAE